MFFCYEDIFFDFISVLRLILDFLGLNFINDDVVVEVVNYVFFENMRKMEKNNVFNFFIMKVNNLFDYKIYKIW